MERESETSNANVWELEVLIQNKEVLNGLLPQLSIIGVAGYEVSQVSETLQVWEEDFECKYLLYIYGCWFKNLIQITEILEKLEDDQEATK